ncbi:glycosyltransferase family 4 protein [Thermodesulfobacteriota bacterium]
MKKIALVSPFTLPEPCGNSILTDRMQRGLLERGFAVRVFNSAHDDPADAVAFGPDLIHSIHTLRPAAWLDRLFDGFDAPLCITLTGTDYNCLDDADASHAALEHYWRKAAALVVFHQNARKLIAAGAPWAAPKLHIIPQGIEAAPGPADRQAIRQTWGLPADAVLFLMVSGIRPVKNIPFALRAFQQVEQKTDSAAFVHAGPVLDPEEAQRVQAAGKQLHNFYALGPKTHTETCLLMAAADVFLNTSLHEGMSGAMLESMAAGLPVIATAIAGNTTLVQDQHTGCLVPPGDCRALAGAALALAGDASRRRALGACGKKCVENYAPRRELDRYQELYRSVLQL